MANNQFKLAPQKEQWVTQFKPTSTMRGKPLNYPITVEAKYAADFTRLINQVIKATEKEVANIFKGTAAKEYFAADESIASQARILTGQLTKQINSAVKKRSKTISKRMLKGAEKSSSQQLKLSLKELSGGLSIKTDTIGGNVSEVLKASIDANVNLITGMTDGYLSKITDAVNRSIQNPAGNGLQDLIPFLEKQAGMTRRHAKNVALDQTRKAYNALNAARMQDVGVDTYEWVATGGSQDPREYHHARFPDGLNGGIYSLDKPPYDPVAKQHVSPGLLPYCRCRMKPVIKFDEGQVEE